MKKRNKLFFTAIVLAAATFAGSSVHAKVVDKIAAIVNDNAITELELQHAMKIRRSEKKSLSGQDERREALSRLIDDMLFDQLVSRTKIEVTDDDLARAIAGVLHQNRMTLEQLKSELKSKGITYEQYKKDMGKEIKRIKFVNQVIGPQVKITEQDLRDYYQRHQETFRGTHSAHIAEIILPLAGVTSQAEFEKLRDLSLSIVAKARQGKSFAELAMKYSKGPYAEAGGDIGMVELKNIPPIVANTVRNMRTGQVSRPILSENAIIIVKLISLPEISAGDFEKLRDQIYSALYDERIQETLNSFLLRERQRAYIDIK